MNYSSHKPLSGFLAHIIYIAVTLFAGFYLGTRYYDKVPWHTSVTKAIAVIQPLGATTTKGTVVFEQHHDGVHVVVTCHDLTPGKHGFHIHEHGDSSCADGICTGDHFNPTNTAHGDRTSAERHIGDFGNLEADAKGTAHLAFVDKHLKLNGPHSIIGRAVIVHAGEDDLVSQPSGNSGARIGCGVIGIAQHQ